jgi:hypothetical protein
MPARMAQKSAGDARVKVRDVAAKIFDPVLACNGVTSIAQRDEPAGRVDRLLALAASAVSWLAPRDLYAGHGGLGTLPSFLEEGTSLFGPADQYVFYADFEEDVVGQRPVAPSDGALRGTWSFSTLNPGDITVQSSLGNIASQLVVINQGGGNAATKPGINLLANVTAKTGTTQAYPVEGTYSVGLRVVVASPRVFTSPFILRSSNGDELARFELRDAANALTGPILFNGTSVGTWTQNVSLGLEFVVNLDTRKVGFAVDGTTKATHDFVTALPVVTPPAVAPKHNLAQAGWEITGRDGQIIGMDDLKLGRLVDIRRP